VKFVICVTEATRYYFEVEAESKYKALNSVDVNAIPDDAMVFDDSGIEVVECMPEP
jgi:hypothetical protein